MGLDALDPHGGQNHLLIHRRWPANQQGYKVASNNRGSKFQQVGSNQSVWATSPSGKERNKTGKQITGESRGNRKVVPLQGLEPWHTV